MNELEPVGAPTAPEVSASPKAQELIAVGGSTIVAVVVLRLINTQIYTEPWTIDPWLYTALMTNFDFTYESFPTTYYVARFPAIVPGLLLNSFLTPQQAYVVLHLIFFFAGAVFLYLLARTLFGVRVAVLLFPAILMNAIFVNAHTWDYVDGFVITYLAGGLYFLASCTGRRSLVRPALSGFLFAAAAVTHPFAALLVIAGVAAYVCVRWATNRDWRLRRIAVETAGFLTGIGVLLVVCGLFSRAHGGRFLFFMPSVDVYGKIDQTDYQAPGFGWLRDEPRVFVPVFLAAMVALAWRRRSRSEGERLGLALAIACAGLMLPLALWQFVGPGYILNILWYFSILFPLLFVMLAAAVFAQLEWASRDSVISLKRLAAIGTVAGAVPIAVVFSVGRAQSKGGVGTWIVIVLMATTLVLALALRFGYVRNRTPAVTLVVAALAIGSVGYASATNESTYQNMNNEGVLADAGHVFSIGMQLIDFMETNGLHDGALPMFWYDQSQDSAFVGLHSLYYYGYTLVRNEMPIPDSELRSRLESLGATIVVLLCADPTCAHGGTALSRAGFDPELIAADRLHSGSKSVWVEAHRVSSDPT